MHNQTKLEERYPFVSRKAMNYFYGSQSEDANFTVSFKIGHVNFQLNVLGRVQGTTGQNQYPEILCCNEAVLFSKAL